MNPALILSTETAIIFNSGTILNPNVPQLSQNTP